jgi:5-methylcytosine-specific restriction endonuclease McrA
MKQTARHRRKYMMSSSSSSSPSVVTASPNTPSSEKTISDLTTVVELLPDHTIEFGTSRIYSGHVHEMQRLGYFGNVVGRAPRAEEVPEPKGELVVFEAFFTVGLHLPTHWFMVEVMRRFEVQIHQLTPNAMVALAKFVWVVTSYSGEPSVKVFAKNYYLHWQTKVIGDKVAHFGSCTFTPRTGKTSSEVVELVPRDKNKWSNWWDFWFYVAPEDIEGVPGLPHLSYARIAMSCFHGEKDEEALRRVARTRSGHDLVEEFVRRPCTPRTRATPLVDQPEVPRPVEEERDSRTPHL